MFALLKPPCVMTAQTCTGSLAKERRVVKEIGSTVTAHGPSRSKPSKEWSKIRRPRSAMVRPRSHRGQAGRYVPGRELPGWFSTRLQAAFPTRVRWILSWILPAKRTSTEGGPPSFIPRHARRGAAARYSAERSEWPLLDMGFPDRSDESRVLSTGGLPPSSPRHFGGHGTGLLQPHPSRQRRLL